MRAQSLALGSASGFNNLVDLPGAQPIRASLSGLLPDDAKDLWFRDREAHIVPDAEQHSVRAAMLLNDKRPALMLDAAKEHCSYTFLFRSNELYSSAEQIPIMHSVV